MDIDSALRSIGEGRRADRLAPVTVIAPSRIAALQLRRRLAEVTAYAGVRFEVLDRLAELIASGHLAASGRSPLARPIGDYVAGQVARESAGALSRVRDLPGYARALRRVFRRLRRGGIRTSADVQTSASGRLADVFALYDAFRAKTAAFYDQEDLLDAAAVEAARDNERLRDELGTVYVLAPGAETAAEARLLEALRGSAAAFIQVEDGAAEPETAFLLSPDPASEAREVARRVLEALERGLQMRDIAVLHGAGAAYPRLLREAFETAGIPATPFPGIPLSETLTGRAVLALLDLPNQDYPRSRTMDFFALAPLRHEIPGSDGPVRPWAAAWDNISRHAGVTRGAERWLESLAACSRDIQVRIADPGIAENEPAKDFHRSQLKRSEELQGVISALVSRLTPLREPKPAAAFIDAFKAIVFDYLRRDAEAFEDVMREIEQLGTVDAVGGSFTLPGFHEALRANLDAAAIRGSRLGEGVLLADYRLAAGLRFREVVICGAHEGALPAGPGGDSILEDRVWSRLREAHPYIEDSELALERGRGETRRAVLSAGSGRVTWSCPIYEPGATREYYPAPPMVAAASLLDPNIRTAGRLRRTGERSWLRRAASPIGVMLRGAALDAAEVNLRGTILGLRNGSEVSEHPGHRAVAMLRARRSAAFTEWDGNVAALAASGSLDLRRAVSPTSLENYATCGFRYFCKSVLYIGAVEEPEEREMMDAAARGQLVHHVLESFFQTMKESGRPGLREAWTAADHLDLMRLLEEALADARRRGLTGREVYSGHEARMLRAELTRFLDEDYAFREETGAIPSEFEVYIPQTDVSGVALRGRVDRIDRTPDGSAAWVIDYKTGGLWGYENMQKGDVLDGGTKLQLPVYLAAAADAEQAQALYWFITRKGGFTRIPFEATAENMQRFRSTIEAIVRGVSAGAFPANSGDENEFFGGWVNCGYCDFNRICSRRRESEFAAKSVAPEMAPWRRVGEAARPPEADL